MVGLQGGGLFIDGTATLTNTNVYANQATYVCSPFKLSFNFRPAPRWNGVLTLGRVVASGLTLEAKRQ